MRALIIEDEPEIAKLVKIYLAPYAHCDSALDGETAVGKIVAGLANGRKYDLILLDIMMPKTSGHQVLESIRSLEKNAGLLPDEGAKVIMLTALDDTQDVIRAFKRRCDAYLVKPFEEERLIQEIRELGLLPAAQPEKKPTA